MVDFLMRFFPSLIILSKQHVTTVYVYDLDLFEMSFFQKAHHFMHSCKVSGLFERETIPQHHESSNILNNSHELHCHTYPYII